VRRRQEQRYNRLMREGFPYWEARRFINTKLSDPALVELRKERRRALREAKRADIPKRQLNKQIAIEYRSEGLYREGRYQPAMLLERYQARPSVIERAKGLITRVRVRFELAADERRRYNRLIDAGFLPFEAQTLAKMEHVHPDNRERTWNSAPWKAMIDSRRRLVSGLLKRGYSKKKIREMIQRYYALKDRDPYDFLKREYKPRVSPKHYDIQKQAAFVAKTDVLHHPRSAKRHERVMVWA
jgi:hypothetical protein